MKVVAITSCATGIAHTYMAAEAIKKICKEKGYDCKVEMQGALGIENKLKDKDIKEADMIIFANDVGVSKAERFDAYKDKIKKLTPHAVIQNPKIIFED
ncbi:PTS system fructose-specific IIB component [Breznakia sp. PF5-3]|uniref:PTS fructose transporter subunit IIB n=1 Tax=unclassified Breznakia TaxID=2623764 RepID=UPI0024076667|nr:MULTISPECIES: fructose PTS transporter subunit IIB [unclassified Breznakia]MDL2276710.1 fructose PTS transporter subunit IIB [Breznakia sp. OttesenSCG-928-G09]MDF9824354.1 PTS system fructose-specific IIB component [Breznakia sp. PM6-1]MDF9835055.1 PTS system fructose-specific IIB component [Breznakia sp. PF5-3]MDF9837774.1 PTS system fructose-specific IIB component [Breznakia sp. PFB2-8]MDF9859653.1 PTS system fructose-specific IIB component [Breznakia sp. PH5-24]